LAFGLLGRTVEARAMHQVFFSVKRVHLRIVEVSKRLVREFELTPARFDLLRVIQAHTPHPVLQSKIVTLLGVSAATVSRMLISLEKLGFVERQEWKADARNLLVSLTAWGFNQLDDAMISLIGMGRAEFMARRGVAFEPKLAVRRLRVLQKHLNSMRRIYGDDAPFVHPWRDDDLVPYHYTTVVRGRIRYTADLAKPRVRYDDDDKRRRSQRWRDAA
jgi:DNA-binding MarR family transcriptional regulator